MKIVDVKAYPTSFRVPKERQVSLGIGTMTKRDCVMVKVTTEDGIVGWGESHHARAPGSIGHLINTTLKGFVVGMDAADTVGIDVYRIRYGAVIASGMLAAAGGAFLSIGFVNSFNENMTAGRGFIALAAMIFGNWKPFGAAAACLLFGFSSALAQRLPEYSDSAAVLFQALPYVLTLIAVAGVIGRSIPPAADGKPYQKQ